MALDDPCGPLGGGSPSWTDNPSSQLHTPASSSLSVPPESSEHTAEEVARLQQAVYLHPLYPQLLDAITNCRKVRPRTHLCGLHSTGVQPTWGADGLIMSLLLPCAGRVDQQARADRH